MKLPPYPPEASPEILAKALAERDRDDVTAFVRRANAKYYHWDELRARPLPKGLTPAMAWALVELSRSTKRALPLVGQDAAPFSYWLPPHASEALHYVDRGGGGPLLVDGPALDSLGPMREQVVISSLMEEAIATSQIEGAATTRKVAKAMLRAKRAPRTRGERMILNSYVTIEKVRREKDRPLSIDFLLEIQTSLTAGTLDDESGAGRLRTDADEVVIADVRSDAVLYTPPKAKLLPKRLDRLVAFANEKPSEHDFTHPLVKAAVMHFWLAYEHPFVDGNGRTARALFYWYMLKNGYWLFEFLTLSKAILGAPSRYYRSFLYSEHDHNDLTYSLLYLFDATKDALANLHEYLRTKRADQTRIADALRNVPDLSFRQRTLLDQALRDGNEPITFQSHQRQNGVTYITARSDLLDLVKRGLLEEVSSGRPRTFLAPRDLAQRLAHTQR